jgi:flagellar biosynthesis protein FlhG
MLGQVPPTTFRRRGMQPDADSAVVPAMKRIFSIGGGKGGAGKSFVATSLGVFLARQRKRVVLVDLDLGASNLHTLVGVKPEGPGLHTFLSKSIPDLAKTAVPTPVPNLYLIGSAACSMEIANLYHQQKLKIIRAIRQLPFDIILLDLGAGTHFNTLDFFLSGREGVLVFTPEPTSVENSIRFIRAAYLRRLKQIVKADAFHDSVHEAMEMADAGLLNSPDVIERVLRHNPEKEGLMRKRLAGFTFRLVVNQHRKTNDPRLGGNLENVCSRHFYSRFRFMGCVSHDERVHDSVAARSLYVEKYPYTATATELKNIAHALLTSGRGMEKQGEPLA